MSHKVLGFFFSKLEIKETNKKIIYFLDDCDGTACGGEVCRHEGICNLDEKHPDGYTCDCLDDFKGRRCEIHTLCENSGGCQNKAECRVESADVKCDCPYGYLGDFCETGMYILCNFILFIFRVLILIIICFDIQNNLCTQHVLPMFSPCFELVIQ